MTTPDMPPSLLIPIGAVLAASITAVVSFVSLIISKEQKISEFRQTWIDGLRAEISEFASCARRLSSERFPLDLKAIGGSFSANIEAENAEILRPDPFHEQRLDMAQAYYAVRLRLNPKESDHNAILDGMDAVYLVLNTEGHASCFERTVEALDGLSRVAQSVLKREWGRVTVGEQNYRRTILLAKVLGILLGAVLLSLLAYAIYRAI
jgi:hypothetical protein